MSLSIENRNYRVWNIGWHVDMTPIYFSNIIKKIIIRKSSPCGIDNVCVNNCSCAPLFSCESYWSLGILLGRPFNEMLSRCYELYYGAQFWTVAGQILTWRCRHVQRPMENPRIFGVRILLNCFYKTSFRKTKGGSQRFYLLLTNKLSDLITSFNTGADHAKFSLN